MSLPLTPGTKLGRYEVRSQIGAGGMGEVYLAQDTKLERTVALKILPANIADDQSRMQRFIQEAKAASSLNHPNIITIHEIEQIGSIHLIVSEFVNGETLRQYLKVGRFETLEALDISLQIASALSAAHTAGIIHRDIKPENVMIRRDGIVKILDFGLAKLNKSSPAGIVDADAATMVFVQTEPGVVMGTAAYMSPEQARGRNVDPRTDIFSLGVVIYEMLSGRLPFVGESPNDVIGAILTAEPPPLTENSQDVPQELQRIVRRCLEKDRERRYSSVREVMVELKNLKRDLEVGTAAPNKENQAPPKGRFVFRRLLTLAPVVLGVAALSYLLLFRGPPRVVVAPEIKSLAVIPLENLSGDPGQEYFADGMTEALISNLAQIRALERVISRTSMMRYKGSGKSLPEIAAELKVDAVLEGTVQRSGDRVLVTAKLIAAATDSPMWMREYNRDLSDVLKLQSDVARAVADEIRVQVTPEEQARLAAARNINPQAHEAYLRGRNLLRTNEDDLRQAIEQFRITIQLAPDYAPAHAALSRAWSWRGIWGATRRKEAMPPAREAGNRAVALDNQLAEAHVALSDVKLYDFDWTGAEQELIRALELDPNSADAHRAYADLLMFLARHVKAISEIERAEQLDPLSSTIQSRFGRVLYRARKYEEAEPHLQRAIELDPNPGNSMPYWIRGELYMQTGRYEQALASLQKARSFGGRDVDLTAAEACVYARMGKQNEARRMLAELKATTEPSTFANASVAYAYAALGYKDEAFKVLFRLVEEKNNLAVILKADPPLESLHSDPRWKELLRRMNLQP